jgi:hypothetical protein
MIVTEREGKKEEEEEEDEKEDSGELNSEVAVT